MNYAQNEHQLSEFYFSSKDGTQIAAQMWGEPSGEPVLLINSCASRMQAFMPALQPFADRYLFISWDYRSLFSSSRPIGGKDALSVEFHAEDALELLELQTIKPVKVVAWGTGVQIAIAMLIQRPDCFSSIVTLAGNWQKPLSHLLPLLLHQNVEETSTKIKRTKKERLTLVLKFRNVLKPKWSRHIERSFRHAVGDFSEKTSDFVVEKLFDLLQKHDEFVTNRIEKMIKNKQIFTILERFGVCQVNLNQDLLNQNLTYLEGFDWFYFWELVKHFEHYDALKYLDNVNVPILLINGRDDSLAASFVKSRLLKRLKKAEFVEFERAGHFLLWEKTEELATVIGQFWS